MQPSNSLEIYTGSRAIREKTKQLLTDNQFLPRMMSIGEFEQKVLLFPDRVLIDEETRTLLLNEASQFEGFDALQIESEFFSFIKNAKFILSFFDELAHEGVAIETLFDADLFASYQEQLTILQILQQRYHEHLKKHSYCDRSLMPHCYKLSESFILKYDQITLYLEGYLSHFEWSIFEQIAQLRPMRMHFVYNPFSEKMAQKFRSHGFMIQEYGTYLLNLTTRELVDFQSQPPLQAEIFIQPLEGRYLEFAFIKKSIYDLLEAGIEPEKIAVIVPDGTFSEVIDLLDDDRNFNLAMGRSFAKTQLYQKLEAIAAYLLEQNLENYHRMKRHGYDSKKLQELLQSCGGYVDAKETMQLLSSFAVDVSEEEQEIFQRQLHLFQKLLERMPKERFSKILQLFLTRLKKESLDDVMGGKITVMEILESRGISFDGVVIVDFNESKAPIKVSKDLFLSSDLRGRVGMPTHGDRENLQKYYYYRLIENAKRVWLCYVEDEQNQKSRFIDELGLHSKHTPYANHHFYPLLFPSSSPKIHFEKEDLILTHDFTKESLSASRLKDYFECKRRYYYRYILDYKDAQIPTDEKDERHIGLKIHDALRTFYAQRKRLDRAQDLYLHLQKDLYQESEHDLVYRYRVDLWLKRLEGFCHEEERYFQEGFEVFDVEKQIDTTYQGLKFTGRVDRIDRRDGQLFVYDYKSGKIKQESARGLEKSSNFQLQIYDLLLSTLGDLGGCYYYDLKNAQRIPDSFHEEKKALLIEKLEPLKQTEHNFTLCEDQKQCLYCPYKILCQRG